MGREGWILFVLFWVGLVAGQYDTFYLLPTGSDTTNCTEPLAPCATFGYVMDFVTANSTILVYGGDYYLFDAIVLNNSVTIHGISGDDVNIICSSSNATIGIDGPATIEGLTISNCPNFAISIYVGAIDVTVRNITFIGNRQPIFMAFVSFVNISEIVVFNNSNNSGSPQVQILTSENVRISDSRFIGNENLVVNPYSEGTLSMLSATNVTVENCYFENNAAHEGSGIYAFASTTEVINCVFRNNSALLNGSSIFLGGGKMSITNCTIEGGYAPYGGAIYVGSSSTANIISSTIEHNSAQEGGGIFVDYRSTCIVSNSFISNNSAVMQGGGIYARASKLLISGTTIVDNSAQGSGGGLAIVNCTGSLNASSVFENSAVTSGGGIYMDSDFYISGSTISGNRVSTNTSNTGIFFASNETATGLRVVSSTLSDNSPYSFCCASPASAIFDVITGTMVESVCNYPACNPTTCPGSTPGTCLCPSIVQPIVCNCTKGLIGPFCTIVDQCANTSFCDPRTTCSRSGYYPDYDFSCSACPSGFNGTGETGCVDFNECVQIPNICPSDLNCFNTNGSYQCSVCPPGFTGNGVSCVDVNECLTGNGGCDYHTQCTNTNGSFTCGSCPQGFEGNGYTGCVPQCGNGVCEPLLGEDCVTCHQDCKNATCQKCGDNYCDTSIGENCTSCYQDCGLCTVKRCGGTPTCSGNGDCKDGVCVCTGSWSGPICSQDNTAINVTIPTNNGTNGTDPGIHITPSTNSTQSLTFSLTLSRIMEIDASGDDVYSLDLGNRNYTSYLVSDNDTSSAAVVTSSGSGIKKYALNTTLENFANLEIMIWLFSEAATVEFANISTQYLANTIKISLQVRDWPFRSLQNSLGVVLDSAVQTQNGNPCEGIGSNSDENGNLQWVTINIDGVTMYGQFIQKAVVDDEIRLVSFKLNDDKSVTAKIPHFWDYAVIDPSYSVLLGESDPSCNRKESRIMVIVVLAVVIPIVGIAVIGVVGAVFWRRIRLKWQIHASQKPSPKKKPIAMTEMPENMSFERVTEMKTTTAAGTFSVQL